MTALVAFVLAGDGAPRVRAALAARPWSWPFHLLTGAAALTAIAALQPAASVWRAWPWRRRRC